MRNNLILILISIAASGGDAFAWDDEDDSFGKAASTRRSSLIDYGYGQQKNNAASQRQFEEQKVRRDAEHAKQEADNNDWEARRWRDVETVAGAFVASGPYYKAGQQMVQTDKGLVYSTGNGCVVAPGGFYYRTGNLWVGPNGKLFGQSGSVNNRFIWGSDGETAISSGRGFFTSGGYSWPAYPDQSHRGVSSTMRRP